MVNVVYNASILEHKSHNNVYLNIVVGFVKAHENKLTNGLVIFLNVPKLVY